MGALITVEVAAGVTTGVVVDCCFGVVLVTVVGDWGEVGAVYKS